MDAAASSAAVRAPRPSGLARLEAAVPFILLAVAGIGLPFLGDGWRNHDRDGGRRGPGRADANSPQDDPTGTGATSVAVRKQDGSLSDTAVDACPETDALR